MVEYNEFTWRLELAAAEKNGDKTVEGFYEETKRILLEAFRNQEIFGWLAENRRWQELSNNI